MFILLVSYFPTLISFAHAAIIISRASIYRRIRARYSFQVVDRYATQVGVVIVRRSSGDLIENVALRRRRTSKFTLRTPLMAGGRHETLLVTGGMAECTSKVVSHIGAWF